MPAEFDIDHSSVDFSKFHYIDVARKHAINSLPAFSILNDL
jgi:hypothetical protein